MQVSIKINNTGSSLSPDEQTSVKSIPTGILSFIHSILNKAVTLTLWINVCYSGDNGASVRECAVLQERSNQANFFLFVNKMILCWDISDGGALFIKPRFDANYEILLTDFIKNTKATGSELGFWKYLAFRESLNM